MPESQTLFEKYGGFSVIGKLVHRFYEKVLSDAAVAHYFEGIDMQRLASHQTDFLCVLLGGPIDYTGRQMRNAHRGLAIRRARPTWPRSSASTISSSSTS